jgi:hypothetical protein
MSETTPDSRLIDPTFLAVEAVRELTLAANSGVFDHVRIETLRAGVSRLSMRDTEVIVVPSTEKLDLE